MMTMMTADSGAWIFAYGSLMNQESAKLSIGRNIELTAARLNGWQRTWNAVTDNRASRTYCCPRCLGILDRHIVVTNIIPSENSCVMGACFWVEEPELAALKDREKRYHCRQLPAHCFNFPNESPKTDSLLLWERKQEFCYENEENAAIPSDYISSCLQGMRAAWGDSGMQLFLDTTVAGDFPVIPAIRAKGRDGLCRCDFL